MPGQIVAATMLVVAACYAVRLVLPARLTGASGRAASPLDRGADVAGLVMAVGMAAMWSGSVSIAASTGIVAFTALAVMLTLLWFYDLRESAAPAVGGHIVHHVVGCLAMVYMYAAPSAHASGADAEHHGAWWLVVSWVTGMYFVVAASSLGFRLGSSAPRPARAGRPAHRLTGYCDAVMSASMAAMLFMMV